MPAKLPLQAKIPQIPKKSFSSDHSERNFRLPIYWRTTTSSQFTQWMRHFLSLQNHKNSKKILMTTMASSVQCQYINPYHHQWSLLIPLHLTPTFENEDSPLEGIQVLQLVVQRPVMQLASFCSLRLLAQPRRPRPLWCTRIQASIQPLEFSRTTN